MRVRGWVITSLAALTVGAAGVLLYPADRVQVAGARPAPRFVAHTVDSVPQLRSLDDYAGQPLFLNVWATWCDPCREEMPSIERMYRDYRERGLRVVAVSIDNTSQLPLVREFVREHGLTFEILHDYDGALMQQYQMLGVPQTFLITRRGDIFATRFVADWNSAASRALVDSLLAVE